ncbi:MAG: fibronectin type III domain-containing protein [Ruminiclostridium sp.]|nr:fibronectin type III domain-containing protein [Ruminiclostridium sp.]
MKKLFKAIVLFAAAAMAIAALCMTSFAESLLPAPTEMIAEAADVSVKLTWDAVSGADAYRVYKYDTASGAYRTYKNVSRTSCSVTGLEKSTTYKFKVAALVKSGSGYKAQTKSSVMKVTTKELPAPRNVSMFVFSDGEIILQWWKMDEADAFRVYLFNSKSGTYKVYADAVKNNNVDISNIRSGKTYKFSVAALTLNSDGSYTEQTRSEPSAVRLKSKLPKPTNIKTKVTGSTLTITWDAVKGASSYTIEGQKNVHSSDGYIYNTIIYDGSEIKATKYSTGVRKGKYFLKICANPKDKNNYESSEWYYFNVTVD